MKKLQLDFYKKDSITLSKELLGKYLVHNTEKGKLIGKIVEVEAYGGIIDKAAHSYGGKKTKRTEVMFREGGIAYVYLIYGIYNCLNIVSSVEDVPEAVLIRALEPISNLELMCQNRYGKSKEQCNKKDIINLTSGPGKLCKALDITKEQNGQTFIGNNIYVLEGDSTEEIQIIETTRIGIDYSEEARFYPWRFYIKGNPYISKK